MPDSPTPFSSKSWIIKPLVADEIYTDRAEFLEYFYQAALSIPKKRAMSTVLLGRRRMGKTEIFRRVVNRLFFEQEPLDPKAVVPVYYSFPDRGQERWEFSINYLENFIRHYLAFYARKPEIVVDEFPRDELLKLLKTSKEGHPYPRSLDRLLMWHDSMIRRQITTPEASALEIPRRISDLEDSAIVVFLDEFQNTRLPHDGFDIVGWTKEAVESYTCPHFVTGSAMSILAREILGRGALFGRFSSKPIQALSEYWGAELAKKTAKLYGATIPELMAPMVAERCGGNPFYINAVVRQSVLTDRPLLDEKTINGVLAIDISSGFIWGELHEQVTGWIERVNDHSITKWILYLSALEDEERISLERIQRELKAREGHDVPIDRIQEVLVRLSRGDLVEYLELGGWFRPIDDPILLEFLKVWGRVEVEGQNQVQVQNELVLRYQTQERRIHEYKGYLAEIFMGQVLLNSYQHNSFPGHFFNTSQDIPLLRPVIFVHHRVRLRSGIGQEIDILASLAGDMWICQSKWETTRKMGIRELQALLDQAAAIQAQDNPQTLHKWIFAHEGLTKDALALAEKEGVFWSTRQQLDDLLQYLGLRPLPDLSNVGLTD